MWGSPNLFENKLLLSRNLLDRDGPWVLDLSVLDVCECGADLLPDGFGVVQRGDHQVFAQVEDSLDRRHYASGA